jgi:hypothetical protein
MTDHESEAESGAAWWSCFQIRSFEFLGVSPMYIQSGPFPRPKPPIRAGHLSLIWLSSVSQADRVSPRLNI